MSQRVRSTSWTGPLDLDLPRRDGVFTHRPGDPHYTSDYQHFARMEECRRSISPERAGVVLAGVALLLVSPLALWLAHLLLRSAIQDLSAHSNHAVLVAAGFGFAVIAGWQLHSGSNRFVRVRTTMLWFLLLASTAVAGAYVYVGIQAHRDAIVMQPTRALEFYTTRGSRRFKTKIYHHQLADGTMLDGSKVSWRTQAPACVLVQQVVGNFGFRWVRVLERSRSPTRGQLHWPVRRQECFSGIPLSSLPR